MARADAFSAYDAELATASTGSPWTRLLRREPRFEPDYGLLTRLLSKPVAAGEVTESGRFARGIDAWLASELRRAGFGVDEVWPRATRPRVLPRDVGTLLDKLPLALAAEVRHRLENMPAVGPADARILGRAYDKQVDVCIARWDRGPELMISTKAQVSSFGKNLPNRFEEAYGDAANLRSRYPLAAVGFFFVQRSTVLDREPDAFERAVDMMRKLRDTGGSGGYTATGFALVEWDEPAGPTTAVRLRGREVPEDIAAPQFFRALISHVLEVTPVVHHVEVRRRFEGRDIPVDEDDEIREGSSTA